MPLRHPAALLVLLGPTLGCSPTPVPLAMDTGDGPAQEADGDGDGYAADADCDDADPAVHPGADERCDGVDNDCDHRVDDADDDVVDATTTFADADRDGYGDPDRPAVACDPAGGVTDATDCDDVDPNVHPGAVDTCGDGRDQDCVDGDATCPPDGSTPTARLPVAPTAAAFGWQGRQDTFLDQNGAPCSVPIVLALGDQAACYVDPDGELRCAGRIFTEEYGTSFQPTGVTDVSQVILTLTVNVENGNTACALVGGTPTCLGYYNYSGQLGNGGTGPNTSWTPWAAGGSGFVGLATGTSDSYCARNEAGEVWCTGYDYGKTPKLVDPGPASSVWISTFGETTVDDPRTFRAAQSRTECQVTPEGLLCGSLLVGRPGHVVDGGLIGMSDYDSGEAIWLEDDGRVQLYLYLDGALGVATDLFTDRPVLAIAYQYYTDSICAVYDDGSLACVGSNTQGMLGTGDTARLTEPKVVLPPGTFDVTCR